MAGAEVVRWAWRAPWETLAGIMPARYWWTDGEPRRETVQSLVNKAAGWQLVMEMSNGLIATISGKSTA